MATLLIYAAIGLASSFLISLLTPKPTTEAGRQEFEKPSSRYGESIPRVWGKTRVPGILIWGLFPPREEKETSGGGKGGSPKTEEYKYYGNCAFLLCEKTTSFGKVWLNSELLYNAETDEINPKLDGVSINRYFGSDAQLPDPLLEASGYDQAYRHRSYIVFEDLPLEPFGNRYPQISVEVVNGSPTLEEIVTDVLLEHGFESDDFEAGDLADINVTGFFANAASSAKEKLATLQQAYFFNIIDTGGKILFKPQYQIGAPIPISENDLGSFEADQTRSPNVTLEIVPETDLPTQYEVKYYDASRNYLEGVARSIEYNLGTYANKKNVSLNLTLTDSEGAEIANKLLLLDWVRRRQYKFTLPPKWQILEPGDVITFEYLEENIVLQISRVNIGANTLIEIEAFSYQPSIYTQSHVVGKSVCKQIRFEELDLAYPLGDDAIRFTLLQTIDGGINYDRGVDYSVDLNTDTITLLGTGSITIPDPPNYLDLTCCYDVTQSPLSATIPTPVNTELRILDLNKVFNSDPDCFYVLARGAENWKNASLYSSVEGSSYTFVANLLRRSTYGECLTILPAGATSGVDTVSTLDVEISKYTSLESISTEDFAEKKNWAAVAGEILQFKNATLLGATATTKTYRLDYFKRGLKNTKSKVATHVAVEPFSLLHTSGYVTFAKGTEAYIGKTVCFKAPSTGQTIGDVLPVCLVVQGNASNATTPIVTGFSPTQGDVGTDVAVYGSGFDDAVTVKIGGVTATDFVKVSNKKITVKAPSGVPANGFVEVLDSESNSYQSPTEFVIAATGGGGGGAIIVKDEGVLLTNAATSLDFTGDGVTASAIGGAVTVSVEKKKLYWVDDTADIVAGVYTLNSAYNEYSRIFLHPIQATIIQLPTNFPLGWQTEICLFRGDESFPISFVPVFGSEGSTRILLSGGSGQNYFIRPYGVVHLLAMGFVPTQEDILLKWTWLIVGANQPIP